MRSLLVNSVLVLEQEIAEEAEREPMSYCDFSAASACSCSNALAFGPRLNACFAEQEAAEGTERKLRHTAISLLSLLAPVQMHFLFGTRLNTCF